MIEFLICFFSAFASLFLKFFFHFFFLYFFFFQNFDIFFIYLLLFAKFRKQASQTTRKRKIVIMQSINVCKTYLRKQVHLVQFHV